MELNSKLMAEKIRAIVNEKEVMLSPEAFKIAAKHYGAIRATVNRLPKPEKPKELVKAEEVPEDVPEETEKLPEKPKRTTKKKTS